MPMHPRTPEMLSRLIGIADAILGETRVGRLRGDRSRSVELGQVYGELVTLWGRPPLPDVGFDETALLLAQCLMHLDEYGGPLGELNREGKWAALSAAFLGFVRTDLARALTVAPATSNHDFPERRKA